MTTREIYVAMTEGATVTAEMAEWAASKLEKLDAANEKRRNSPSKTMEKNAPLAEKVYELLGTEPMTASDIATALNEMELDVDKAFTAQKATSLAKMLVTDGRVEQVDMKLPKRGTVKGYVKL